MQKQKQRDTEREMQTQGQRGKSVNQSIPQGTNIPQGNFFFVHIGALYNLKLWMDMKCRQN